MLKLVVASSHLKTLITHGGKPKLLILVSSTALVILVLRNSSARVLARLTVLLPPSTKTIPAIRTYREDIIKQVQNAGFVETLTGRKRYLPQINDGNYQTREFAKRAAMNAPIQGSAADLIKLAMIKIDELLSNGNYKSKLILQVHDELIFSLDSRKRISG